MFYSVLCVETSKILRKAVIFYDLKKTVIRAKLKTYTTFT